MARCARGKWPDSVRPCRDDAFRVIFRAGSSARVAQLDRVTASEAEGCGFDSRRAHHLFGNVSPLGSPQAQEKGLPELTDGLTVGGVFSLRPAVGFGVLGLSSSIIPRAM